jgi:rod shape-determining protein MreB
MVIHLLPTLIAIDPGTANTLLYVKGRGVAVNEPSLVTVRTSTGVIEAVGGEAEAGRGRTPRKFQTARPIRDGIVSDHALFNGMLQRFLRKARVAGSLHRLKVVIAVPGSATVAERGGVIESLRNAGAADVILVDQVLAAGRGAGLPMEQPGSRVVVNIGAGVTEVALISLGSIVCAQATRFAGDEMDAAIAAHVQATHQLCIGEPTAERLKIQVGSAVSDHLETGLPVRGRCVKKGVPREATVRGCEVREALCMPLKQILNPIREVIEQAPPELSAGLRETGIMLTGGSALLRNLDRFIGAGVGLPVRVASNPLSCVILGLAHQVDHLRRVPWRRFRNGRVTDRLIQSS